MAQDIFADVLGPVPAPSTADQPTDIFADVLGPVKTARAAPPPATGRGGRSANQPSRAASTPDRTPASGRSGKITGETTTQTNPVDEVVDFAKKLPATANAAIKQLGVVGAKTNAALADVYQTTTYPLDALAAQFAGSSFGRALGMKPYDPNTEREESRRYWQQGVDDAVKAYQDAKPEYSGFVQQGLLEGLESVPTSLLALGTTFATGSPNAGLAVMGATTGLPAYADARAAGKSGIESTTYGIEQGVTEALTEKIALTHLYNDVLKKTPIGKTILNQLMTEIPGEQVATLLQDLSTWAHLNPDKPFQSYLEERPSAAAHTLLATISSTVVQTGGVSLARSAVDTGGRIARRNPADTRTPPPGIREAAEQAAATVTPEDEASPLDTGDIVAGRVEIAKAEAGSTADSALGAFGMPKVGTPVTIDYGDGTVEFGTMRDTFADETGAGVIIEREGGKTLREYNDTLTDAGVRITPRETAGAPAITVPVVTESVPIVPQAAPQRGAGLGTTSDILSFIVDDLEGGAKVISDSGGVTKYGISAKGNPGIDVANLTRDEAMAIYRRKYWIADLDRLDPAAAAVGLDASINHGPAFARRIIKESGGDAGRMLQMRRAEYARLAGQDPAKYGRYAKGWENRLAKLEARIGGAPAAGGSAVPVSPSRDVEPMDLAQPDFGRAGDSLLPEPTTEGGQSTTRIGTSENGNEIHRIRIGDITRFAEHSAGIGQEITPERQAEVQSIKDYIKENGRLPGPKPIVEIDTKRGTAQIRDGNHRTVLGAGINPELLVEVEVRRRDTKRPHSMSQEYRNEFDASSENPENVSPARPAESTVEVGDTLAGGMPVAKAAAVARGDATPAPRSQVAVDMLKFIARSGGIAYDGLNEQSRREGAKGHDLRNTGALATFVPGAGPLLRPNGLSLDQIGEKLWEAGYFGSPEVTPRPDENAVLRALEDVTRTKEKRYSSFDDTPAAKPAPAPVEGEDGTASEEAQQAMTVREAWDAAAAKLGLDPLFQNEIDDLQHRASDALDPTETDPDVIAQYMIALANAEMLDVQADAFYESEDEVYAAIDDQFRRASEESGDQRTGSEGQPPVAGNPQAGQQRGEDGSGGAETGDGTRQDGLGRDNPLDNGPAVDPALAAKQARAAQMEADAPLRGANRTGTEQDDTIGLGLFDAVDQPQMDLSAPAKPKTKADRADTPTDAAQGPIDDFGEKLVGARKDTWQSFRDRMDEAKKEDVTAVPLSKSWPEPDYQQLLDSGADQYAVAAMRAMRDAIPTKPRSYGVVAWGKQVEALRDTAEKMIDDAGLAENFTRKLTTEFSRSLRDLQGAIDLYMEFGHERSFKGITFGSHHYSLYRGEQNVTKWTVEQKQKATAFSNWPRELAVADTREEALAKFKALLANGGLDKKPAVVRFDIYSRSGKPGFWIGKKVGKTTADLKWFETVKEARAFKVEHYDDLVAMLDSYKDIPPERKEVNSPRVGINHRNGADVTPDQFMETFGFRGVQFGNYVEGARRQEDLNEAYDALMDLAGVLGIPAKALSLNGTLGLAFGARGKGGKNAAMAHFEPGNIVINLTKKQGAGSLAHEWWHGLDNYFARQRGNGNFVTETTGRPAGEMRQEMADAFKAVMAAIKQTAIRERSRELDKRRTKEYWSTDIEMSARSFESYVIAKLQDEQFSNDYLANVVSESAWAIEGAYPYPVASEIAAVRAGFDGFFQAIESRQDGERVPLYSLPRDADLPTVTLGTEGWGPMPRSAKGRMDALRQRVGRWYGGLVGSTVTSSDGRTVQFGRQGRKKTLRAGEDLLSLARAIPKIIEQGRLIRSEPADRPGFIAVHRYGANVQGPDGTTTPLVVLVREATNGTFHYSLHHYVDEGGASNAPATAGGADQKNSNPALDGRAEAGINLFRLTDTDKADTGKSIALDAGLARLQDELRQLGIANKVALRLVDTMGGAQGSYVASLITVSRDGTDTPVFTLHHEAVHALRDMGVFSPADWALLVAKAKRTPGLMRQINRRYMPVFRQQKMTAAQMEDALNEEAVADLFAMWQRGDYQAKGTIERLFQRLRGIVDAIKRFGKERERTADDVLREIADGTMGARAEAFTSGGARGQVRPTFGRKLSSPDLDMSTEARQARAIAQGFLTEAAWQEMKGGQGNVPEGRGTDGRLGYVGDTSSTAQKAGRDEGGVAEDQGLADADRSGLATFYHGTSDRIGAFALDHPNRKDNGWLGRGVYLTDDPALARMYAMQKRGDGDEQIMELHARLSNPYRATLATKQELRRASAEQVAKWTEDRIAEGHDGTILIYPDGTAEVAVFDPANLREPDAAFDPEQRDSANLKFSIPDLAQRGPFKRDQAADDAAEASLAGISRLLNDGDRGAGKIGPALEKLRVSFQDKMLPVLRLQEAVSRQLGRTIGEKMNPYLAEETMHGRIGARLDALMEDHVQPLVEAMASAKVELIDFEDYIYARHAPERNAQIAKINEAMPDGGSGMTNMEARAVMNRIERAGMTETMESLAARYDAMMAEAKQRRIDAGLLSQEEADAWDEAYEFYAPLRGRAEVEGEFDPKADARMQRSSGLSVKGKESKRAFGRRTKAADILSYAVLQAEEAIVRSEQNRVGNAFLELAKTIGDGDLLTINKVERRRRINPTTGLVEFYTVNQLTAEDAPFTISTKVDGTEHRITMNRANPQAVAIADAMRNLSAVRFELLVRTAGKLTRFFSAVNTRFSPPFIITNAIRDVMTAATTLQQYEDMPGLTRDVLRDWRKALVAGRRGGGEWAKWRREWELAGGKVAFNQMVDFEGMRERMHKDIARVRHPNDLKQFAGRFFEAVETVNDAIERAVRLSVYANARKRGVSKAKAASMSLNVTVNFTRKGQFGPAMNSAYAFFNASTQGSATLIFAAMRSKKVRRTMLGFVLLGFALDMINAMISGDDDDGESYWDKMPEWEKSRNLILMLPGGFDLKIPLAPGINTLFGLGRRASAVARGAIDAGEAVTSSMMEIAGAFNPIGGGGTWKNIPSPTISDWVFDIDANKDFTGRPIQPEANPFGTEKTPSNNYFPTVSVPAKWLAQTLNDLTGGDEVLPGTISVSPEVLEYVYGYFTGGVGRFVEDAINIPAAWVDPDVELTVNDWPVFNRLVGQYPQWLDKSLYYDRAHETRDKLDHVEDYVDLGKEDKARAYLAEHPWLEDMAPIYKAAEKEMKRIRKDKREVNAAHELGELTDAQHREGLKIIKANEDNVVLQFNTAWNIVMDRQEQSNAD